MLSTKIDGLISESMKTHDHNRLSVLRLIKTEFVKKEKDGVKLDEKIECAILQKMISQREDSINQYKSAGRKDLVESETIELNIIKEYAPKQVSDEEIKNKAREVIDNISKTRQVTMKDTKEIISIVQETYPTANGKIISQVIKEFIH